MKPAQLFLYVALSLLPLLILAAQPAGALPFYTCGCVDNTQHMNMPFIACPGDDVTCNGCPMGSNYIARGRGPDYQDACPPPNTGGIGYDYCDCMCLGSQTDCGGTLYCQPDCAAYITAAGGTGPCAGLGFACKCPPGKIDTGSACVDCTTATDCKNAPPCTTPTCTAGVCSYPAVVCNTPDSCHTSPGSCSGGACTYPLKGNGVSCGLNGFGQACCNGVCAQQWWCDGRGAGNPCDRQPNVCKADNTWGCTQADCSDPYPCHTNSCIAGQAGGGCNHVSNCVNPLTCTLVGCCNSNYGNSCSSCNICLACNSGGTYTCGGSCSVLAPSLPPGYGTGCQPCNLCNQCNSGTIGCSGSCTVAAPPLPAGYGTGCQSCNVCGQCNSGTIGCSGTCSVTAPGLPPGYGTSCQRCNSCGQCNSGTINCTGACSVAAPPESGCVCSGNPATQACPVAGGCGVQTQICPAGSWTYTGAPCATGQLQSCTAANNCAGNQTCQVSGSWNTCSTPYQNCDVNCDTIPDNVCLATCSVCNCYVDKDCALPSPNPSGSNCYFRQKCTTGSCSYSTDAAPPLTYYNDSTTCYHGCTVSCDNSSTGGWKRTNCVADNNKRCALSACTGTGWDNVACPATGSNNLTGSVWDTYPDNCSEPVKAATVSIVAPPEGYINSTGGNCKYHMVGIPSGTHSVSALKPGYRSATVMYVDFPGGKEVNLNFTLTNGSCQGCADWEGRCSVSCSNSNAPLCFHLTVPSECDGAKPGSWVVNSTGDGYVLCCQGAQVKPLLSSPVSVSGCMPDLVQFTRIVNYMNQPVTMKVYTWKPCSSG